MANFSFDYGDAHWTVLDTNPYVDWTDPALRAWLDADLASAAAGAAWRFVAFHHPPFNSSKAHADEQRTRVLAAVFEDARGRPRLQRPRPQLPAHLPAPVRRPTPAPAAGGKVYGPIGHVDGRWTLDTAFDGATRTRPDGVIYVVTGAGGARLYNPEQHDDPASWQAFTAQFVSNVHSLTVVDVTPDA